MEDESNLNAIRQLVAPMEDGSIVCVRHLVGFLAPMEDESIDYTLVLHWSGDW